MQKLTSHQVGTHKKKEHVSSIRMENHISQSYMTNNQNYMMNLK